MPRRRTDDLPEEVAAIVEALRKLAAHEGLTRTKVAGSEALCALSAGREDLSSPARARDAEDMVRTHVNSVPNLKDRALLVAGLNLDGWRDTSSYETRIINLLCEEPTTGGAWTIEAESAIGRFRSTLLIELAWRLLGGAPTFATPEPPSNELSLAERLHRQHRDQEAAAVLRKIATTSDNARDRRDSWRVLATMAYQRKEYVEADMAFSQALKYARDGVRGGRLAMAIDRYARQLTDEEDYERALAVVDEALATFLDGRWLWRRRGCVQWYAGSLLDAFASLTYALNLGYPASRVFHARGQVLAELGQYERAIAELDEALKMPRSELSTAQAIGAKAFATGMAGDLPASLGLFDRAEITTPDSGWLHFWRALCYLEHDRMEEAKSAFSRADAAITPRLPPWRRERGQSLMATYNPSKKTRRQT
jgi:tetratricopeptide (TPR) repeat protein